MSKDNIQDPLAEAIKQRELELSQQSYIIDDYFDEDLLTMFYDHIPENPLPKPYTVTYPPTTFEDLCMRISKKVELIQDGGDEFMSLAEIAMCAINLESCKNKLDRETYELLLKRCQEYQAVKAAQEQKLMNIVSYTQTLYKVQADFERLINKTISPEGDII